MPVVRSVHIVREDLSKWNQLYDIHLAPLISVHYSRSTWQCEMSLVVTCKLQLSNCNTPYKYLGYILAWTQPLKNGHDQNSFSEKHKNTVFLVTLAITTSDTNTTICGHVRGRDRENGGCARQKSPFCGHNLNSPGYDLEHK